MLGGDGTVGPQPRRFSVLVDNQLQHHAVWVSEREHGPAKASLQLAYVHAMLNQAFLPVAQ